MKYTDFLVKKTCVDQPTGLTSHGAINEKLFPVQKDIVNWMLKRGRALCGADCGLGKTPMQLETARLIHDAIGENVLILAPLAVSQQTVREAAKFSVDARYCREQLKVEKGVTITNYECLEHFDASKFGCVVLDESSILKNYTGKMRNQIITSFKDTPFRFSFTATPAPNDYMELGNQAEFVGAMSRTEMLATFFTHDGGDTSQWRLKGHAQDPFWRWMASYSVILRKPSDLGYSDEGFVLPPLKIHKHILDSKGASPGFLFEMPANTLNEQRKVKRDSIEDRCKAAAKLINKSDQPWVVWCELNDEGDMLEEMLKDCIQVSGKDEIHEKEEKLLDFTEGRARVIVSKPSIAGFGLNWQHCPNMAFVNLSHSYEQFYQAVRRCWRFGQKDPVNVHQFLMESESPILENIERKQREADGMAENMVKHMAAMMSENVKGIQRDTTEYKPSKAIKLPAFIGATA